MHEVLVNRLGGLCLPMKSVVRLTDGWMTCDFMSFSTVFHSYQDDEQMIMNGCAQLNPIYS